MEPLDFRKFVWTKGKEWFSVLAITTFGGKDVIVYQHATHPHEVKVMDFSEFCMEFTPTYDLV